MFATLTSSRYGCATSVCTLQFFQHSAPGVLHIKSTCAKSHTSLHARFPTYSLRPRFLRFSEETKNSSKQLISKWLRGKSTGNGFDLESTGKEFAPTEFVGISSYCPRTTGCRGFFQTEKRKAEGLFWGLLQLSRDSYNGILFQNVIDPFPTIKWLLVKVFMMWLSRTSCETRKIINETCEKRLRKTLKRVVTVPANGTLYIQENAFFKERQLSL